MKDDGRPLGEGALDRLYLWCKVVFKWEWRDVAYMYVCVDIGDHIITLATNCNFNKSCSLVIL